MAKVYIALVGGQPYPVFLGLKDSAPDRVVLVHSEKSKEEAERIKDLSGMSSRVSLIQMLPVSLGDANEKIKKIKSKIQPNDELVVNISSGTKVWTYAFIVAFMNVENAEFCYVDQNCNVFMLKADSVHTPDLDINIDTVLQLNGTNIVDCTDLDDFNDDDFDAIEDLMNIRKKDVKSFHALTQMNDEQWMEFRHRVAGEIRSDVSVLKYDRYLSCAEFFLIKSNGMPFNMKVSSPHLFDFLFNCAWFEVKVADILSRWNKAKEVLLNVKFPYKDKSPKNEIDVLINTGERLLFVECKTQIFDITDIDKFRTAVKNYGGMGCKALFVTLEKMKDTAKEKCQDSDILCFSLKDHNFHEQALYDLLDSEIYKINKK